MNTFVLFLINRLTFSFCFELLWNKSTPLSTVYSHLEPASWWPATIYKSNSATRGNAPDSGNLMEILQVAVHVRPLAIGQTDRQKWVRNTRFASSEYYYGFKTGTKDCEVEKTSPQSANADSLLLEIYVGGMINNIVHITKFRG